ncbi:SDR family NAD(P)-dependent oxidoreductase [Acidomonas methanolica]|uniref:SDR family NAD(P)-dependent oxidoreductase n=1 Tax=Acidomonas methanolica TaxID=437 RepID=UPI002119E27A|nr:SDR family NAD(P)-dependent oxidoreductase [Acidomonas methanolica]MCQ9154944.1 SDR family oxidoreductase [Acidomonas methanolica]
MELGLDGKVVFITGAAKGMGAAISRAFAREGSALVVTGRDVAALEILADSLRASCPKVRVLTCSCNITDPADVHGAVRKAESGFGRIDVLVNVAGGTGPVGKTAWETSAAEFEEIVSLNLTGCFNTMRAVLPGMIERRYGKIVNVGGTFGMRGRAGRMSYSASKWGLRGLTKSTAIEAGRHNINVNIVAPGMVDGDRFRNKVVPEAMARLGCTEEEAIAHHAADYALRRISLDEDVANACLFLASDVSRQISGVDLPVDGGWAAV